MALALWKINWPNHLATDILSLVDPNSQEAQRHPYLHEVLSERLNDFMDARNDEQVSRCTHFYFAPGSAAIASGNSSQFQTGINLESDEYFNNNNRDLYRLNHMCSRILQDIRPYALIGSGSYGSVFLARDVGAENQNPAQRRHYAIKVETHCTMGYKQFMLHNPSMTAIDDQGEEHFIPYEALLLLLASGSERFPTLHSVFVDDELHSTIMSACLDHDVLQVDPQQILEAETDRLKHVVSFSGSTLKDGNEKKPVLNELECCKVASQLLEGEAYLRDMNLSHSDLARQNYLLDENLNVTIIDLGMSAFAFDTQQASQNFWPHIDSMEYLMAPELAIELAKDFWKIRDRVRDEVWVYLPHNVFAFNLWRLGCLIFDMLHGYGPWESPGWDADLGRVCDNDYDRNDDQWDEVYERRDRIINDELQVDENLSQDCIDALRMMLAKEPSERPSITEMEAMPWFGQWAYHENTLFVRPNTNQYREDKWHNCGIWT